MSASWTTAAGWHGEPWAAVAETHSAVVFFAGDRAWKLKKPVDLGSLDFAPPQARAAACHRETDLTRRFGDGLRSTRARRRREGTYGPAAEGCGGGLVKGE